MALAINDNNFEELVMKADKPVLLDFGATWCGPCKALSPIIDEIATEYEGRAVVGKVDVEESPVLSGTYKIRNVPTVLFILNGEIKYKSVGAVPKAKLTEKLDSLL
ncbi:MAG: thioredoxin [Bacteroidales bacterium]|nr:thioredoxin [Bacteroidales bacterium]